MNKIPYQTKYRTMVKILSTEKFCPPKILSAEIQSISCTIKLMLKHKTGKVSAKNKLQSLCRNFVQ